MSEETQERQEETGSERTQETLPEGTAARKPVKKWVRILSAVLAGVILIAAGFTAGWVGNYFSIDPRIRELEWVLSVLEDEHYQEVDMDAVYEDLYDAAMLSFTSYTKVGSLSRGTAVQVVGTYGNWAKLSNGYYVSTSYLAK